MHPFLIAAQFVVIQVIDDDVVRTCFPVSQTTWRLSASASQEFHPVGRLELPILPGGIPLLLAEVGNDALVMFQFCLNISQQTCAESSLLPTTTMKLMRRLGWNISHSGTKMSMCVDLAWPRGHMNTAFRLGVPFYFSRCRIVERCIVDGAYDFPRWFCHAR